MEKDPDSLATVAVGPEKLAQSNYAASEVYSASEPPPAYMRPLKSSAVQIARIAGITLVSMSVILGSFILASSYVQARLSCTPESIAQMQAHAAKIQKHAEIISAASSDHGDFQLLNRLHPEALVQNAIDPKENLQNLSDPPITKKEIPQKEVKAGRKEQDNGAKTDNENGEHEEDEDDYEDDDFPPVHIKLPLQLDLDDIAGALIQQARHRISCVVERRRADEVMDRETDDRVENGTDPQRFQRLSGERVSILCEAGNPQKEQQQDQQQQQQQEMLTPIIVPLGTLQIPSQSNEANNYNQYQVHSQYQVPDMQQLPVRDSRANQIPMELRNLPQMIMEMRPPRMGLANQEQQSPIMSQMQMEVRQIPIELRHFPNEIPRNMRAPEQQMPMMYQSRQQEAPQQPEMYNNREQSQGLLHPPPPPPQGEQQHVDVQLLTEQRPPMANQPQQSGRPRSPFHGIPHEIQQIIQQVPLEIKNIIQHITGEVRAFPIPVNEEMQRREPEENVQEFKPFPEGARPIPVGIAPLPIEMRNLLEHGNVEGRPQQQPENSEEQQQTQQQQEAKPFPGPEDRSEEIERTLPAAVRRIIHHFVEGRAIPISRFSMPLRQADSMDVQVEAQAEVTDGQENENREEQEQGQQQPEQQEQGAMEQQRPREETEEENRPHYVQPRSVRSVPEPFTAHRREKRVRRLACNCVC